MAREVTLSNGQVVQNVPDNVTDEQVQAKFDAKNAPAPEQPIPESSALDLVDIGGGLAGGIGGAMYGTSVGGPVGGIVGGIAGGALGTFGGSLLENELKGEDLDYYTATKEALVGIGFDVALLGVGNRAKAIWNYMKQLRAKGANPQQSADVINNLLSKEAAEAGSQKSLQETQQFLESQGATLTPAMVGASGLRKFQQRIAELGIFSAPIMQGNMNKINGAVQQTLGDLLSPTAQLSNASSSAIGSAMLDVINGGRRAIFDQYEKGMDEILATASRGRVQTQPIYNQIKGYLRGKQVALRPLDPEAAIPKMSTLEPQTQQFIREIDQLFSEPSTASISDLISIEKTLLNRMRKYGDPMSKEFNSQAYQELTKFQGELKNAIRTGIASIDPKAAKNYTLLQKEYSDNISGLLPELTKSQVTQAKAGNFTALGTLLTQSGNVDRIGAFFRSIDSAYSKVDKNVLKTMPFKTAKEAKKAIRDGFLMNLFPDMLKSEFTVETLGKLATDLGKPDNVARLKVIMGEDYNTFRRMLNIMEEAQGKPESNVFALALRSKEAQAVTSVAGSVGSAIGGTAAGGPILGLGSAAVFLGTPVLLAKAATNPKTINRIIKLNQNTKMTPYEKMQMFGVIADDIMRGLTQEEREEFFNEMIQMEPEGA